MGHTFHADTKGTDVVEAFSNEVKHKTFLIIGITKNDLATTTATTLAHGGAAAIILVGYQQSPPHEQRPQTPRSKSQSQSQSQLCSDDHEYDHTNSHLESDDNIQSLISRINNSYPKVKVISIPTDLTDLSSVRSAADKLRRLQVPIDGVVVNPTRFATELFATVPKQPQPSDHDTKKNVGVEVQFQVNYLSPFLMVNLLLEGDCISRNGNGHGGRVVLVSSSVRPEATAPWIRDVNFENGKTYHPLDAYAQSIFANILLAKKLAKCCASRGIAVFSVNPGNIKTNLQTYASPEHVSSWLQRKKDAQEDLPLLIQQAPKSLSQGCATVIRALLDPALQDKSGAFLDSCQVQRLPNIDFPAGAACAEALWQRSEELVGQSFKWTTSTASKPAA